MTKQTERKSIIATEVEGDTIVFDVRGAGKMSLDISKVHADVARRAMLHGFIQRVSDKAAIARNTDNGQAATPAEKFEAMKALVDHFMSGTAEWNIARAEGAGRKSGDAMALAAVAEATGKTLEQVRETIKAGAEAKKTTPALFLRALCSAAKVKPILERMQAEAVERAQLDGDDLLEGI